MLPTHTESVLEAISLRRSCKCSLAFSGTLLFTTRSALKSALRLTLVCLVAMTPRPMQYLTLVYLRFDNRVSPFSSLLDAGLLAGAPE
jgi:hypothetical protein